jgi:hypothetical protein
MIVTCKECHQESVFDQPYAYHAGFSNQGFLYDDAGTCTLIWSSFDPAYVSIAGQNHPWMLTDPQRVSLEAALKPSPSGGHWRFANPPRCPHCGAAIEQSILHTIYYFVFPGSVNLDQGAGSPGLAEALADGGKPAA